MRRSGTTHSRVYGQNPSRETDYDWLVREPTQKWCTATLAS